MKFRSQKFNKSAMALSIVSSLSMVISPLAQATEAAENAKYVMQQSLAEVKYYQGKDKQPRLKDLWAQMKQYVPKNQKIMIDNWMAYHGDQKMPRLEPQEVMGAQGQSNIRLMMHYPQGSLSVTYLGTEKAFMKMGDQVLTREEVLGFFGAQNKLAKEKVVKAQVAAQKKTTDLSMPKMSYEMWNAMKPEQRAEYLVWVRIMLEQAQEVYRVKSNAGVSSKEERSYAQGMLIKIQGMMTALNGFMAGAAGEVAAEGKKCVVAGFVATFNKNTKGELVCDINKRIGFGAAQFVDEDTDVVPPARSERKTTAVDVGVARFSGQSVPMSCPQGNAPCNPFVYGPGNCVNYEYDAFQKASAHYSQANGQCDDKSKLTSATTFNSLRKLDCFKTSSCQRGDISEILKADSTLKQNSSDLINKILKAHDSKLDWSGELGPISPELYKELNEKVFSPFQAYIGEALAVCGTTYNYQKQTDVASQSVACEGLKARKLAMEYIQQNLSEQTPLSEVVPLTLPPGQRTSGVTATVCDHAQGYLKVKENGDVSTECVMCPEGQSPDAVKQTCVPRVDCAKVGPEGAPGCAPFEDKVGKPPEKEGTCSGDNHKWCVGAALVGAGLIGYLIGKNKSSKKVTCMPPLVQDGIKCKPVVVCGGNTPPTADGKCVGECPAGTTRNVSGLCIAGSSCPPGSMADATGKCYRTASCPTGSSLAPDGVTCLYYITCTDGTKVLNVSSCPVTCLYPLVKQGNSCVVSEGGGGSNPNNPGGGGVRGTR